MRTVHAFRSQSFASRAVFAIALCVLAAGSGRAPVRAQQAAPGAAQTGQSATLLPDGRWLLIGGEGSRGAVQIRDVDGRTTLLPVTPLTPRAWHTATVLSDGSVLIVGGTDARGTVLAAPERYTPGTQTFEPLSADGLAPRARHTATLLTDGRVLIVGGASARPRDDADLWDPALGTATPLNGRLEAARTGHEARLEPDGRVLLEGGAGADGRPMDSGETFDPATGDFEAVTSIPRDPAAFYVTSVTPLDRARDVPIEAVVALRFSQTAAAASVSDATAWIEDANGPVASALVPAEGGRLLFIRPAEALRPATAYRVRLAGLVGAAGRPIAPAVFSFTTMDQRADDPKGDDEAWTPNAGWTSGRKASPWQSLPPLAAPPGVTALAGQVLRLNGAPLADVTLRIEGRLARTDRTGRFLLGFDGPPAFEHTLEIDATTASRGNRKYGFYEARVRMNTGATTVLPFTIWSPVLDTAHAVTIASPTPAETVVATPTMPGLELHLPRGTVIRNEDGGVVRTVTITPIPLDRTPFPLPANAPFNMFFTIQPGGAYISTPGPIKGAWLVYPNRTTFKPGTKVPFYNYDPDDKGWFVYGMGTVTPRQVVPDARTRLYAFTGASFDSGPTPPQGGNTPPPEPRADPVDPSTGAFVMTKTDLYLPDVMPLALTRTYNAQDAQSRAFGIGMTHIYGLFQYTTNSYNTGELVLPDGGQIHYVRTSANGLPWYATVFENQSAPTAFYHSQLSFIGNNWEYHLKDGTVYVMGHQAPLQSIRDRYGNEIRLTWSLTNIWGAGYGNLTRITSPNGRWIEFTYDSATPVNHVTQATDNIGRTVTYTYDTSGRLSTVTDPENHVTTYTWDTSNRLISIEDGRQITWLTNQYDTSNRVTQQTLADPNATWQFAYTTTGGSITQTDVTDPRGHVERLAFNADHYTTSDTDAYGTSLARTTTITRQAGSNLPTAVVDPLSRRTEYTYDTSGHVLTRTALAGTTDAVTTTFTYEPEFFQLASVTDPLTHTWSMSYDSTGRLTGATDPLSHQTAIALSATGQLTQTTDALQHTWQYAYAAGDLASVTDPLSQVRSQFVDQAGRVITSTDPLGRVTRTGYDTLNRVTSVTDPQGGVTSFTYDANSNLLSLSDALTHTTSYTYDDSDRVASRTDPLSHAATFSYDLAGHLSQATDRTSQVTSYSYDALDRLSQVTFDDASTVSYTYDAGDRVTQIADSANGTITRQYDDLDRLTEETTAEGTVDYTYDADGRRASMTVAGQTAVTYNYDDAHRLTSITQGSATVVLAYDAADRRTSLTYPNGIVASYTYDNANHLAGISYVLGATTLGDLTYTYDAAGNRVAVGGTWARTNLPAPLASATYDAANRIATWGGVSSTYDLNGNLTNDGIRDRYGNEIRLTWSLTNIWGAGYGNLTRITSPNGRWIEFTYDAATPVNHVTQAMDNIGRTVTYTYDTSGRLSTVTDPENDVTTYTWDTSNRLVSIEDGRQITWLTNQYDTSNRVTQQTLADPNATWQFAYTTTGGSITQTDVTDPRGHVERLAFNADHYTTSDTEAYGTSLARTTTITRQAGSNLPTAVVDPLSRRTGYTYDTSGHVLTRTALAGTTDAVTTTFTYEPAFFQLASVTDPLTHTWSMSYDSTGRLTGATDPLSHQTAIALSATGQLTQTTDALQHTWQYAYAAGDLASVTDPLSQVRSQFVDQAGRVITSTDPLGRVTRTGYDTLNRVTSVTDPQGGVTSFTYDANSNLLSLSDALTHTTSYTYDDSDRVASRTDPLSHAATFSYDLADHLSQATDRKGQDTSYSYDALDRLSQVTFDDASTVTYTYDAGDRVTQIADSANGTITRQYDDLDRLTEETTAEGTVDYTYDADGRRASMTVAGQTAVTYDYDDAHRLTSITQGSATVVLAYDAADRRTSLTYPNGIVASYTYDAANQLAGISYVLGATTLGDLTYTYDAAGNRVAVGGTWARTNLPAPLASATYDAANRIATWGGVSSTYDLNGNLTNDGTTSYTWNARDQLTGLSGGTSASLANDALGRRRSKTIGSTTTAFLYDGDDAVVELSGTTPTATRLTGVTIDETFIRTDGGGSLALLTDALGSSVALADMTGTVQAEYTYEPFGAATAAGTPGSNLQQFTGRESDDGALFYYRARYLQHVDRAVPQRGSCWVRRRVRPVRLRERCSHDLL